ncbi:MAG: phage tail protein [Hyphomicrobiaceae bacterium]
MAPVIRPDPYSGYSFLVTVSGISDDGLSSAGSFSEVSGMEFEVAPIEYRTGSELPTVRKMRGLVKYTNIVCKRGITGDLNFWNWILTGANGQAQRADVSIVLRDEDQQEVIRWNFRRAWPCKYTGPSLNAANNEIAMETVEICHEGFVVAE